MGRSPSSWTRLAALWLGLVVGVPGARPAPAVAQDGLDDACAALITGSAECYRAAAAVRLIQPRVALAALGGSPVPGSASTLGMRIGSFPRISVSGRLALVPMELPPLLDRSDDRGTGALSVGLSAQTTVGILSGWSPLPTVGGVLSLDAIGRVGWASLSEGKGFDGGVLGWSLGLRVGALRESLTLPGLSITGSYGRIGAFAFGDPGGGTDGWIEGSVGNWNATVALTRRFGALGLTAGVARDRYSSDVDYSWPGAAPGGRSAEADTDRWSGFANASWTLLVFHASLEAGWQEAPTPVGLPDSVSVDPVGWWLGAAFRLSI